MNDAQHDHTTVACNSEVPPVLGSEAYASATFHQIENDRVLATGWICAGFLHTIPEPGDAVPLDVAGRSLILVRDAQGEVHVVSNICRHRGMRVLQEPTHHLKRLVCPYHAWTYDLTGRLCARAHHFGPGRHDSKGDGTDLPKVRHALWHDMVFVNLDGQAPPFEEYAQHLLALEREYGDLQGSVHMGSIEFDIAANWKIIAENFIDAYHVQWLHPALNVSTPMTSYRFEVADNTIIGRAPVAGDRPGYGAGLPDWPEISDTGRKHLSYVLLFPNFLAVFTGQRLTVFHMESLGPDSTRETVHVYMPAATSAAQAEVEEYMTGLSALNNEDVWIVEELQRTRSSAGFDGGSYGPVWDQHIAHFDQLHAESMAVGDA